MRIVRWLVAVALGMVSCGGHRTALEHPLTNELDPAFGERPLRTLATLPFATDVSEDEDPDQVAAGMTGGKFYPALDAATQYTLLGASEVARVLEQAGLTPNLRAFYADWISDQEDVDTEFVQQVASLLKVDAVVGGAVDLWHQDEIDMMQTGAARTHVGILVGLFDGTTGRRLWFGRDSQFRDGLRYSGPGEENVAELERQIERTNKRTLGGVYAPPDYAVVLDAAVAALVAAFPQSKH